MLVNKEIARKLRDIGFRESTDYQFNHYGELIRNDYAHTANQFYADRNYDNCDVPDKSDVFAWFRKKGLCGSPDWIQAFEYYTFDILMLKKTLYGGESEKFNSWEEAEDACILMMIEMLEGKMPEIELHG